MPADTSETSTPAASGVARTDPDGVREAMPGLARLGVGVYVRTARWSIGTSLRIGSKLARATVSSDAATELVAETRDEIRKQGRRLLGIVDSEGRVAGAMSDLVGDSFGGASQTGPTLRDRGDRLLLASADVHYNQGTHPAYERMLSELTPDEARILRLFATSGQQPAVDIRAGFAFVPGSRLVMQGYTMIAAEAGCRFIDQIPAYLSNLNRLGLIWFSHDPVRDRERYQVLEVQPEVLGALREAGRFSYVLRRSIHLTPLGEDFCEKALSLDTAEFQALSERTVPDTA